MCRASNANSIMKLKINVYGTDTNSEESRTSRGCEETAWSVLGHVCPYEQVSVAIPLLSNDWWRVDVMASMTDQKILRSL